MAQRGIEVRQLRQLIERVRRRGGPRGRRYSRELRCSIVEHALAERARGVAVCATADMLGVPQATLYQWLQHYGPGFREVSIQGGSPAEPMLRLITAQGHRVEGLGREDLVQLLRALA